MAQTVAIATPGGVATPAQAPVTLVPAGTAYRVRIRPQMTEIVVDGKLWDPRPAAAVVNHMETAGGTSTPSWWN